MTMQASDYIWYRGEKYVLIDCEKNKSVIDLADFHVEGGGLGTVCRRGYLAEYFIENNFLFGEITVHDVEGTKNRITISSRTSPRLKLSYTGSMVVAINNDGRFGHSDFLGDYLNFDRAFEWYFIDGELLESADLSVSIQEWRTLKANTPDILESVSRMREIAESRLQYEYGINYKHM